MASHSGPSTHRKMAWQKACQSASTSGGLHLWSPTFDVSIKVRNTPSSCARKVSSSAPFRTRPPGKSAVNFGFTTFFQIVSRCKSPAFTALPSDASQQSPSSILLRLLSNKPVTSFTTGLSPSLCWLVKSFSTNLWNFPCQTIACLCFCVHCCLVELVLHRT